MATMTVAGTDKNQLKWHQKKWQMWPVVVMAAATAAILTKMTATMAAVAGSDDSEIRPWLRPHQKQHQW